MPLETQKLSKIRWFTYSEPQTCFGPFKRYPVPSAVAICKCAAHTNNADPVSKGNARADGATKQAAIRQSPPSFSEIPII